MIHNFYKTLSVHWKFSQKSRDVPGHLPPSLETSPGHFPKSPGTSRLVPRSIVRCALEDLYCSIELFTRLWAFLLLIYMWDYPGRYPAFSLLSFQPHSPRSRRGVLPTLSPTPSSMSRGWYVVGSLCAVFALCSVHLSLCASRFVRLFVSRLMRLLWPLLLKELESSDPVFFEMPRLRYPFTIPFIPLCPSLRWISCSPPTFVPQTHLESLCPDLRSGWICTRRGSISD